MSTKVMGACWPLQMPPTPKAVLISLADNANDHGICWPSLPTICERTCLGKTAVIGAVKWLEANNALSIERGASRSNRYTLTPHLFEGDLSGDHHYVYCITHKPTGHFYVGLRSCYSEPAKDDYWGSGKACEWLASVRDDCRKDVVAEFPSRDLAAEHETSLLRDCITDPRCLNRRVSAPRQSAGQTPTLLNDGADGEPSARRIVREANHSVGERGGVARRMPTVREANPNRQEPSRTEKQKKRASAPTLSKPAGVEEGTWADWLALRKAKRAPVTQTVVNHAITEAGKAGLTLESFLRVWCARGSQGLEAEWLKPNERGSPQRPVGKQVLGVMNLEDVKNGARERQRLAAGGDCDGAAEAPRALAGPDTRR